MYTDNLVFVGDDQKEVEEKYIKRKKALKSKGFKVNVNKIKAMKIGGKSSKEVANNTVDSCRVCGKRVTSAKNADIGCIKDVQILKKGW